MIQKINVKRWNGFRFTRLEVYNWGTFNRKVHTIAPEGETSLLTGVNGSGKSTLVDAIITLIVPNNKRNYNLAGTEKKKERTEKSYVMGVYGRITDDSEQLRTQYLRREGEYSVLLAVFENKKSKNVITLAQFFWIDNNLVKKIFIISDIKLSIESHFSQIGNFKNLKNRLQSLEGVRIYDQFKDYSKSFCKEFGLSSEKALDLFNQTVAIKAIGNLNDFVRTNMLEKVDVMGRIEDLKLNYRNLTASHEAIIKARKQLEQLGPIECEIIRYKKFTRQIRWFEDIINCSSHFFAGEKALLLEKSINENEVRTAQLKEEFKGIEEELQTLNVQLHELEDAYRNDSVGRRIEEIKRQIEQYEERLDDRKRQYDKYRELAVKLNLPLDPDSEAFYNTLHKLKGMDLECKEKIESLNLEKDNKTILLHDLRKKLDENGKDLESLRGRINLVPRKSIEIRDQICNDLQIEESEVPYVCELIKVKASEREWEGAIERFLHNFGLCLLAPERFYKRISNYVNQTDLKGRLVYHRITGHIDGRENISDRDKDDLFYKVELKPDTSFKQWLENELLRRYNYVCCDDMERFYSEKRAITKEGLKKDGKSLHEKDDRKSIGDKRFYILGWSNKEKVAALENEQETLLDKMKFIDSEKKVIEGTLKDLNNMELNIKNFLLNFNEFSIIDWKGVKKKIDGLNIEKTELERSSDKLKRLQEQIKNVKDKIQSCTCEKVKNIKVLAVLEHEISKYGKELAKCRLLTEECKKEFQVKYFPLLKKFVPIIYKGDVKLENIDEAERQFQNTYSLRLNGRSEKRGKQAQSIIKKMANYLKDFSTEVSDLTAEIESMDDFCDTLQKIREEKLPEYENRFKKLLQENVIDDIVGFNAKLDNQLMEIRIKIDELNNALRSIDYTPNTYIQLQHKQNMDIEVNDFKEMIKGCIPDAGDNSFESNEKSFNRIRVLIERFDNEERWKVKVTDVRNWLNFNASERYLENDSEKELYESSSGKSGGQTVKMAYTILASAISYQFGLGTRTNKSFHFVVIDEVFSNLDSSNSRYAMELFKRLDLQLLVVTPFDKVNIVEPYISTCHLAGNNEELNDSRVCNITMEELKSKRARFALQSGVAEMGEG